MKATKHIAQDEYFESILVGLREVGI